MSAKDTRGRLNRRRARQERRDRAASREETRKAVAYGQSLTVPQHWVVAVRLFFSPMAENPAYTATRLDDNSGEDKPRMLFRFLRRIAKAALVILLVGWLVTVLAIVGLFAHPSWSPRLDYLGIVLLALPLMTVWATAWGLYVVKRLWPRDELVVSNGKCAYVSARDPFQDNFGREIPLSHVAAVEITIPALWGRMFGYGHVLIRARGNDAPIYRRYTPNPGAVKKMIDVLVKEEQA